MNKKFTVIIPTMWRYEPFIYFLKDLISHELIEETIIINNDSSKTPILPNNSKLRLIDNGRNIFVNPSWNQGVRLSKTENIIILNDDIIFDLRILQKVAEINDENFGLAGICPGSDFYKQPEFKNGLIDIVQWDGGSLFGLGQMMFLKKSDYINIPYQMQIYYGDDWIVNNTIRNKKNIYSITNVFMHTPYAVTSGEIVQKVFNTSPQNLMSSEKYWYEKYIRFFDLNKDQINELLYSEYVTAMNTTTGIYKDTANDINEHLPTLYEYGCKCNHITELGVRTGMSTRAFLYAQKTLRSYDIVQDDIVQGLFYAASNLFDAKYFNANTLDLEIEQTDLLFIDTDHTYEQLSAELKLHGNKANKYLIFHDTTYHCADIVPAIFEFMDEQKGEWIIDRHYKNNNGLTILKRRNVE